MYITVHGAFPVVFNVLLHIMLNGSSTVSNTTDAELVVPQVPVDPFQTLEVPFARFNSESRHVSSHTELICGSRVSSRP